MEITPFSQPWIEGFVSEAADLGLDPAQTEALLKQASFMALMQDSNFADGFNEEMQKYALSFKRIKVPTKAPKGGGKVLTQAQVNRLTGAKERPTGKGWTQAKSTRAKTKLSAPKPPPAAPPKQQGVVGSALGLGGALARISTAKIPLWAGALGLGGAGAAGAAGAYGIDQLNQLIGSRWGVDPETGDIMRTMGNADRMGAGSVDAVQNMINARDRRRELAAVAAQQERAERFKADKSRANATYGQDRPNFGGI